MSTEKHLGYFPLKNINDSLGCKRFIDLMQTATNFRFNIFDMMSALIYARTVQPCSKSKTYDDVIPNLFENHDFHWTSCIPVWSTLAPNTKRWSRSITTRSIRHIRLIRPTHTLIVQTFTLRLIKKMISAWKAPQKKTAGNRSSVWACSWMPTRSLSVWKCILGMKVKNPLYATSLMILKTQSHIRQNDPDRG